MYEFKEVERPEVLTGHLNLGGADPEGNRIDVNSLCFTRNGRPWIGVMGEFHFSRCKREYWYEELCKMKAGGITLVSTYLFWIYHEETEGEFHFEDDNDIRSFILDCRKAGLEVVIRIGPWAHGECRNGGFPDWLLEKPFPLRENNPEYLEKVRIWYEKIAEQVQGLFYRDGGNIIAIQLENELTDGAEHIAKLKEIAIECGMVVPLYTVTGWNSSFGARIPVDEVVPVFGGYCDAPWDPGCGILPPSSHYFFHKMRNDSAIGADLIAKEGGDKDGWRLPYERYPFATCELGGGLHSTHHRRYIINGMDIYAISLIKLGVGNNLVGYYMYHGGTNQIGRLSTLQESKATGYPNDYPILSYDFQAPLSEYGEVREHYRLLNLLHLFLHDFDDILAPMPVAEAVREVKREDTESLRYGMRTDGSSGFVFINHYQRHTRLKDLKDVVINAGPVTFPAIDVCGEISFFMPFNLNLSGNILEYATAQPICRSGDTYFFAGIDGIKAEYCFRGETPITGEGGCDTIIRYHNVKLVTLTWEQAKYLRRLNAELYIGSFCDLYVKEETIYSAADGDFSYFHWNGEAFDEYREKRSYTEPEVSVENAEAPYPLPEPVKEMHIGGERRIIWKKITVKGRRGFVSIPYRGDAAQLYVNGELAADQYYCGPAWRLPAGMLDGKECYLAVSEMRDDFYSETD